MNHMVMRYAQTGTLLFCFSHLSGMCACVCMYMCVCWCVHVCTNLYVVVHELVSSCIWRAEADILFNHYLLYLLKKKKAALYEPQLVQRCSVACQHVLVTPCLYFPRSGAQCPPSISVDLNPTGFLFPLSSSSSRASTSCVLIS